MQTRCCLRSVTGSGIAPFAEVLAVYLDTLHIMACPFCNVILIVWYRSLSRLGLVDRITKQFLIEVAIPIYAEIDRYGVLRICNLIALAVKYLLACRAPYLASAMQRVYVCCQTSACVSFSFPADEHFSSAGITKAGTERLYLVWHVVLKSPAVRVYVT